MLAQAETLVVFVLDEIINQGSWRFNWRQGFKL